MKVRAIATVMLLAMGALVSAQPEDKPMKCSEKSEQTVPGKYCGVGGAVSWDPLLPGTGWMAYEESLKQARAAALAKIMQFTGLDCIQDCEDESLACLLVLTSNDGPADISTNWDKANHTVKVKWCLDSPEVGCSNCQTLDDAGGDK